MKSLYKHTIHNMRRYLIVTSRMARTKLHFESIYFLWLAWPLQFKAEIIELICVLYSSTNCEAHRADRKFLASTIAYINLVRHLYFQETRKPIKKLAMPRLEAERDPHSTWRAIRWFKCHLNKQHVVLFQPLRPTSDVLWQTDTVDFYLFSLKRSRTYCWPTKRNDCIRYHFM